VRSVAIAISVVFQPLLMPTLVYGMILFAVPEATSIPDEFKERIFYLNMPDIKDRRIPFLITTAYFLLTTWFLYQKNDLDSVLWLGMAVICISVVILTGISFFWKMSAHMTGTGGLLGVVLVLGSKFPNFEVLYPLLGAIVLCGSVASSRLFLHAHRPLEVYVGFIAGFVICWLGFSWIWT
jgi:hypothetical protein